jgi:hypothetical protein
MGFCAAGINIMMKKNEKRIILFIRMRVTVKRTISQGVLFWGFICICIAFSSVALSCSSRKEEAPVIPPITSPLTREYIGFGVITASYTHIMAEPVSNTVSLGYLRRGSLVKILQRSVVRNDNTSEFWVQVEGNQNGWLKEEVMDIYDNEDRAKTAADSFWR